MGFSKKSQLEGGIDNERKKWFITGISIKPVKIKLRAPEIEEDEEEECSTTPTAKDTKIPEKLKCPPAPRKKRPVLKCRSNAVREFFNPPSDLETVFIRRR
ncbi:hypothetical protein AALP_AA6G331500 [Arabis alpina]|uniref:Cyclin-dependent protein kinase inhibitor SMR6-like n=1 Tax=Arabis alpina TaxID=50452 RepID=A0A087GTA0_ARAAL|nr:hypothetical protein AALP_AA6G331500 [Arabis alpina]